MEENNEENLSMKEKLDIIFEQTQPKSKKKKNKEIRLPMKAKVKRLKARKGYIGIIKIEENGNMSMEKQPIEDSTYRLKSGSYHAINGSEILRWKGKFPVVIQSAKRKNPYNFSEESNEVYGQKYIMARMLKDAIKIKNKGGGKIIIYIIIGIAVLVGIQYYMGGR